MSGMHNLPLEQKEQKGNLPVSSDNDSLSVYKNRTIRVVKTYLPADDLTEIVVYIRALGCDEEVVSTSPDYTHQHDKAESMGHDIGRFWIDEH